MGTPDDQPASGSLYSRDRFLRAEPTNKLHSGTHLLQAVNPLNNLTDRQIKEVELAQYYVRHFDHGTAGHLAYQTISALADTILEQAKTIKHLEKARVVAADQAIIEEHDHLGRVGYHVVIHTNGQVWRLVADKLEIIREL